MSDHAVIVPTSLGPVGGVVSEPRGKHSRALVLVPGLGPSGRAGVNANWTRLARRLTELGFVVLRFDLCMEGESTLAGGQVIRGEGWRRSTDLAILREVVPWFVQRTGESHPLLVGSCHGGRVALEFAACEPAVGGLFLIAPYLWAREPAKRTEDGPLPEPVWAGGPTFDTEEQVTEALAACLGRMPVRVLLGSEEVDQVEPHVRRLEATGAPSLDLEVVPDTEIHPVGHPLQQEVVHRWLYARLSRLQDPAAAVG